MAMVNPVSFGVARPVGERQAVAPQKAAADLRADAGPDEPRVPVAALTRLAQALASAAPPVDHARIARLSQAIAQGSYGVDTLRLADAMLRHHLPAKA